MAKKNISETRGMSFIISIMILIFFGMMHFLDRIVGISQELSIILSWVFILFFGSLVVEATFGEPL
jgi:hypothetical protein